MTTPINEHEGNKYLRTIYSAFPGNTRPISVDVYSVLKAFNVTCPAIAHATKKLLCAGERGKGDKIADLKGALAAINRAIELAQEVKEYAIPSTEDAVDDDIVDNVIQREQSSS